MTPEIFFFIYAIIALFVCMVFNVEPPLALMWPILPFCYLFLYVYSLFKVNKQVNEIHHNDKPKQTLPTFNEFIKQSK